MHHIALGVLLGVVTLMIIRSHTAKPAVTHTVVADPAADILTYVPPPGASTNDRAMQSSATSRLKRTVHIF